MWLLLKKSNNSLASIVAEATISRISGRFWNQHTAKNLDVPGVVYLLWWFSSSAPSGCRCRGCARAPRPALWRNNISKADPTSFPAARFLPSCTAIFKFIIDHTASMLTLSSLTLILGFLTHASNLTAYPTVSSCTREPVSSATRFAKEMAATLLDSHIPTWPGHPASIMYWTRKIQWIKERLIKRTYLLS